MADEFSRRRKALMRSMRSHSIAVIPAARARKRNNDVEYPFRQDSNFLYLTGLHEPDAILVLAPRSKGGEYLLFCPPREKEREVWDGVCVDSRAAVREYGADRAYSIEQFEAVFLSLLADREVVYWGDALMPSRRQPPFHSVSDGTGEWFLRLKRLGAACGRAFHLLPIMPLVHELRLRKSPAEIRLMKRAAEVTVRAHRRAMRHCRPGMREFEVEAEILHEFNLAHTEPAYPCIVGGGANACTLHYIKNDCVLKAGDLLLIDAGAEYQGYACDITRTFPVGGRFKPAQRELYEIVLEAQNAAIKKLKVGNRCSDYHQTAVRALTKGLKSVGLLRGSLNTLIKKRQYLRFYMHGTGHWLGLDVHDAGDYQIDGKWRPLESGMVMTVEPGLYIRPAADISRRWWNTGIRIEDVVWVTPRGPEVITRDAPKQIDEIEALMADG